MNNEPVAELLVNDGEPWGCRYSDEGTLFNADGSRMDGWIPLYTHPVKELTDEEILQTIKEFQEDAEPPYKEYENTYLDGWQDACNEIYSAIFKLLEGKK